MKKLFRPGIVLPFLYVAAGFFIMWGYEQVSDWGYEGGLMDGAYYTKHVGTFPSSWQREQMLKYRKDCVRWKADPVTFWDSVTTRHINEEDSIEVAERNTRLGFFCIPTHSDTIQMYTNSRVTVLVEWPTTAVTLLLDTAKFPLWIALKPDSVARRISGAIMDGSFWSFHDSDNAKVYVIQKISGDTIYESGIPPLGWARENQIPDSIPH